MPSYLSEVKIYLQPLTNHPPEKLRIFRYSKFPIDSLFLRLYRPVALAQLIGYLLIRVAFAILKYQAAFRFR